MKKMNDSLSEEEILDLLEKNWDGISDRALARTLRKAHVIAWVDRGRNCALALAAGVVFMIAFDSYYIESLGELRQSATKTLRGEYLDN